MMTDRDEILALGEARIAEEQTAIEKGKSKAKTTKIASGQGKEDKEPTQLEILLEIAAAAELFHTADGDCFARFPVNEHWETWLIRSKGFRRWLSHGYYRATGTGPNSDSMQAALNTLEAMAQFDGAERPLWVRLAEHEGKIYIDLANPGWEAIEITPDGWQVVANPPVCFRRPRGMLPLAYPERGGSVNELRPFLNLASDEDFILMIAYLLAAMRPRGPYPVAALGGEQGTAKSTTARGIRSLGDPNISPLRSTPRNERDLMIAATNSWILSYDNLSGIPHWLSDAFCRLSTGGGISNRELYTNQEETILDAMRPVILNGIDSLMKRPDLADRYLIFNLPPIPKSARRPEEEFWADFEKARPRILGGLLDAVSTGLKNLESVKLPSLPRMADFARWIVACEPALPWPPGSFMAAYDGNRQEAVELSLEADVVAVAVRAHMADKQEWSGKPTELYEALKNHVAENTQKSKEWPKAAHVLTSHLKRMATFLRKVGLVIDFGKSGNRKTTITRKGMQNSVRSVQSVQPYENRGFPPDASKNSSVQPGTGCVQKGNGGGIPDASMDGMDASQKEAPNGKVNNHAALDGMDAWDASLHTLGEDIVEVEL